MRNFRRGMAIVACLLLSMNALGFFGLLVERGLTKEVIFMGGIVLANAWIAYIAVGAIDQDQRWDVTVVYEGREERKKMTSEEISRLSTDCIFTIHGSCN